MDIRKDKRGFSLIELIITMAIMAVFAGAIIGGTSMNGGVGTVTGTLLGVFVMSLLKTGFPYIGLQANWQQIFTGLVLVLAIFIDVLKNKKTA